MTRPQHSFRRAYTLVEMTLAVAVAAVLMGGLGTAVILAGRAVPDPDSPTRTTAEAYHVVEHIAGELFCAHAFLQRSATAVEFRVFDRDGDLNHETIRYAWSGTPGDPLTRKYNANDAVNVVDDVHDFTLTYRLRASTREGPRPQTESGETLLISCGATSDLADFSIDAGNWPGEYFLPSFPPDTVSWTVTRVQFQAKVRGATDGVTAVQLRLPDAANLPSSTVLGESLMYESSLTSSYQSVGSSFAVSGLSPDKGLCLVLRFVSADTHSCNINHRNKNASVPGASFLSTSNGGTSWSVDAAKALLFSVYGTVTTLGAPPVLDVYHLTEVGITLRIGPEASTRVETAVQILNEPEVIGP